MSGLLAEGLQVKRGGFALAGDFAFAGDAITAVFGPSGSGKSLLLNVLAGLSRADAGRVSLAGRALEGPDGRVAAHRRGIGLVFQDARLFPHMSVRGNLAFAARHSPTRGRFGTVNAVAALCDVAHLLDRAPRHLSGGERSRVALARALLGEPDFLLLDEPFAALDGARREALAAMLAGLHRDHGLPLAIVTHQIEEAAGLASRLIAMAAGRSIAAGDLASAALSAAVRRLLAKRDVGAALPSGFLHADGAVGRDVAPGSRAAVWVRADAVLIATRPPEGLSARHVFPATITEIEAEASGARLALLRCAAGGLLSRVTPDACAALDLRAGREVWAVVKASGL